MPAVGRTRGSAPGDPRLVVAALFLTAVFAWGLGFYGLGFYLSELNDLNGWSVGFLSLLTFGFYTVASVLGLVVGPAIRRGRARTVFLTGAVGLGAGAVAVGNAQAAWQLAPAYLLLAVGWACLNSNPISSTVIAWYGDRSATPLTVALTGASAGGIIMIPLIVWLTGRLGFAAGLTVVGLAEILVIGTLAVAVIHAPDRTEESASQESRIAWGLLGQRSFWLLTGGLGLAITVQVGFLIHQLRLLTSTLSDSTAATLVAATTAAAFVGRLIFIAATRTFGPAPIGLAFIAVQLVALVALGVGATSLPALAAVSVLFGLGVGVLITLPPLLTRSVLVGQPFEAAFPLVNVIYAAGVALGAPVFTILHRVTGSYPRTAIALAAACSVSMVLIALSDRSTNSTQGHTMAG